MDKKKTNKPRRNKFAKVVSNIQETALQGGGHNLVSKELTYQQALSIHLRSRQLAREGAARPHGMNKGLLAKQVERCYEQRKRQQFGTPS